MAKKKTAENQVEKRNKLPEYGEIVSLMQSETSSILTDYIRQYIGIATQAPMPGEGIFINFDRVLNLQTYQDLAWYDLYAEMERDPHVRAILESAKLNVAGLSYSVTAHIEAGQKKPTTRNQAIADFVGHVLDNTGYFPQHLYNLMGALGMGFSASEIIWDVTGDGVVVKDILNRPQRRFQFDAVTREPKIRDITNPYFGTPLPANKFIVHRCGSTWQNPFGDALDQSLYWMWLFKKTALKFWIQYLQTGASSIPIVKHPASANDKLKDEALAIAQLIRNGAYGRIPENFEIIWAEASNVSQSVDAYEAFVRQCNDEMSKCVNGQTLTAEASGTDGSGSRALGEVHELTQNARDLFRARALESTLNVTIIKWIVDFNFSSVDGYPKFRFDVEQSEDLNQEADIVQKLSAAGYNFDEKELSEKFNYTITKKEALNLVPSKEVGKEEGEEEKENNEKENLKENEK